MSQYRKTVAAVVGAIVTILVASGIIEGIDPSIQAAVTTLLTAAAVYLVPNIKQFTDENPYEGSD